MTKIARISEIRCCEKCICITRYIYFIIQAIIPRGNWLYPPTEFYIRYVLSPPLNFYIIPFLRLQQRLLCSRIFEIHGVLYNARHQESLQSTVYIVVDTYNTHCSRHVRVYTLIYCKYRTKIMWNKTLYCYYIYIRYNNNMSLSFPPNLWEKGMGFIRKIIFMYVYYVFLVRTTTLHHHHYEFRYTLFYHKRHRYFFYIYDI